MPELSRDAKIEEIRRINTQSERIYEHAFRASGCKTHEEFDKTLKPGKGKGLEPKLRGGGWCGCHNRNPCPIDLEYERLVAKGI